MVSHKTKKICEFGDFQTPDDLASQAVRLLNNHALIPQSIIEPTCGQGAFLLSAAKKFTSVNKCVGLDINKSHLEVLQGRLKKENLDISIDLLHDDFFIFDWDNLLNTLPQPVLIIGNPPWVTSAELGMLQSSNLPTKSNFQGRKGLEAITGKSNFDISEWMLIKHLEWLEGRAGTVAMLCKTAVARKVLIHAWKHRYHISSARIYRFNAMKHFNASVDACFFVMTSSDACARDCDIYERFTDATPSHTIGYHDGVVIADVASYKKLRFLNGMDKEYVWRSGVKHDCSKIMEFEPYEGMLRNGNKEKVSLEDTLIYPLFKSSDIGNGRVDKCRKRLLVTQKYIGEDTSHIERDAPKTWQYLQRNSQALDNRASLIYRNRPQFSIFGVGDYTFAPWKVAISGFYKKIAFQVVGGVEGRPALFDDTIYFLGCYTEKEAKFIAGMLNSEKAKRFLNSMIFWTDKRPITIDLLRRLNIERLARELEVEQEYKEHVAERKSAVKVARRVWSEGKAEKPYLSVED